MKKLIVSTVAGVGLLLAADSVSAESCSPPSREVWTYYESYCERPWWDRYGWHQRCHYNVWVVTCQQVWF